MKKNFVLGLFAGVLLAAAGLSIAQSPAQAVSEFEIEVAVDYAAKSVKMQCNEGCAWEALSFACEGEDTCSALVSETGVGGS